MKTKGEQTERARGEDKQCIAYTIHKNVENKIGVHATPHTERRETGDECKKEQKRIIVEGTVVGPSGMLYELYLSMYVCCLFVFHLIFVCMCVLGVRCCVVVVGDSFLT